MYFLCSLRNSAEPLEIGLYAAARTSLKVLLYKWRQPYDSHGRYCIYEMRLTETFVSNMSATRDTKIKIRIHTTKNLKFRFFWDVTRKHKVTTQNTWIFSKAAVRTSYLVKKFQNIHFPFSGIRRIQYRESSRTGFKFREISFKKL